jgi:D-alanine-D-alanine ligase-like ATP-grasp enzyme
MGVIVIMYPDLALVWDSKLACLLEKRGGIVVGCNSQFIINTLTKNGMKEIFEQNKIATPKGFGAPRGTDLESQVIVKGMSFPLFVKISDGYGSVGVDDNSVCHNMQELIKKSKEVWMLYPNLTVEEFVDGEEYTVSTFHLGFVVGTGKRYYCISSC